jgi:hypothetical protein
VRRSILGESEGETGFSPEFVGKSRVGEHGDNSFGEGSVGSFSSRVVLRSVWLREFVGNPSFLEFVCPGVAHVLSTVIRPKLE